MPRESVDLGGGFAYRFYVWKPERDINPQYEGIPDVDPAGIILTCPHGDGGVEFKVPGHAIFGKDDRSRWDVQSLDPLTLSPSILRNECGCHGFIRGGKWVDA